MHHDPIKSPAAQAPDTGVTLASVLIDLADAGILADDLRLKPWIEEWCARFTPEQPVGERDFLKSLDRFPAVKQLIAQRIENTFIIPNFQSFAKELKTIYSAVACDVGGHVATYIPELARVNPDQFAMAVCTLDGQRYSLGDTETPFCIQSLCKPINYALALEMYGAQEVHRWVGREPSGHGFNHLSLNKAGLPHNPMINSGAISVCAILGQDKREPQAALDEVISTWRRASAGGYVGFNEAVYHSERETADRNFAIGYFLRENNALPPGSDLLQTLEFYFQCCSIETDVRSLSVLAATLANAGICPFTGETLFVPDTVKNTLSLMSSCGMYDLSGEFAFTVGLPGKSGVSGALMVVIPNVMGVALWSPRLDATGNSVRGVAFCEALVQHFNFHRYDSLLNIGMHKKDPRKK